MKMAKILQHIHRAADGISADGTTNVHQAAYRLLRQIANGLESKTAAYTTETFARDLDQAMAEMWSPDRPKGPLVGLTWQELAAAREAEGGVPLV